MQILSILVGKPDSAQEVVALRFNNRAMIVSTSGRGDPEKST